MTKALQNIIPFFFILLYTSASSQVSEQFVELNWKGILTENYGEEQILRYLYFNGAEVDPSTALPAYSTHVKLPAKGYSAEFEILNAAYQPFGSEALDFLEKSTINPAFFEPVTSTVVDRGDPLVIFRFIPIRINPETGAYEKLVSFSLLQTIHPPSNEIHPDTDNASNLTGFERTYTENSVLASGEWYKIRVQKSGVYRIQYDDLISYGINPSTINPDNIRIYGNAGGMLPESNSEFRYDDLQENAIFVQDGADGSFDQGDYILFYGESPHMWYEQLGFFLQQVHYYDDYNYYYLTVHPEPGKRIGLHPQASGNISSEITKFNDYQIVEDETHNLLESGKTWYGDEFGEVLSKTYDFEFPDIVSEEEVGIKISTANRTFINDLLILNINGSVADSIVLTSVDVNSTTFARKKKKTNYFTNLGPDISVGLEYQPAEPNSKMWVNYINVNVISHLNLGVGQRMFRDLSSIAEGAIGHFKVSETTQNTRIWDVTNPIDPIEIETTFEDNQTSFIVSTDSLREFIAFNDQGTLVPEFVSLVPNQNLHATGPFDLVIVTHPLFIDQAQELAELHEEHDDFRVLTITPEIIYNEFSSGKQDPTAIRDLLKMYYDRFEDDPPRYLLLFGDGSFDPKDRIADNTNFIPTFQTEESWIAATSYVVDDYFGLLDDDEGNDAQGYLDVGIGRLPVQTAEEAQQMVDKIRRYLAPETPQFGKWRTQVCMIADDEDSNLHIEQADSLTRYPGYVTPVYNQSKIYLDAFKQLKTPSGDRYPDVTEQIDQQVAEGALIINYIGHGGTGGWAHERILQQNDMVNWKNAKRLPMFITATCEFSRFDEPGIVSGGELVILNPDGGGIALFTTTRLAYSQSNFRLNQRLYERAFTPVNGEMPYLGDLIRESKPPGQWTTRNFVLLGDPALKLSYPKHQVVPSAINGIPEVQYSMDTVRALQKLSFEGRIEDLSGTPVTDFNGMLTASLYDKATKYKTIGNDPNSFPIEFYNQDKIVWEGNATVTNGVFSFTMVVPLDIDLNFGNARFSFYAHSDTEDAAGFFEDFVLGGIDPNAPADNKGPEINLFINDTTFVSGGLTHENPTLLAFISDEHGINVSGNGIGHNMTLMLNDDYSNILIMNPYFKSAPDNFMAGVIEYPFYDLPNGTHTLTLKAWDNYNNSSSASIEFVIDRNSELDLYEVKNYPNPFYDFTTFTFRHTRPGSELDIDLIVYDLTGRYILSYNTRIFSTSTETAFLQWDGRDVNGAKLKQGIYPYTLIVTDNLGQQSIIRQKLVLGY